MMHTAEVIQMVNLMIRLIVIGLGVAAVMKRPQARLWTVPPMTWAAHGLIYYSVLLSGIGLSSHAVYLWTAALGLHGGFLVVSLAWLFLWPAKGCRS